MSEAEAPPEEPRMDNPKRNWRGYLKEYAIIVVGVLTALAAQQAAEWWQWRSEVKQARQALVAEIAENNSEVNKVVAFAPCFERQIHEAEVILNAVETGQKPPSFTTFHHEIGIYISDSEWQSQRSSQVLTHFPHAELSLLSEHYLLMPILHSFIPPMFQAWSDLSVLRHPPAKLEQDTILRLRARIDVVRHMHTANVLNALAVLNIGDRIGMSRPVLQPARVARYCTLDDEQLFDALAKAARRPASK